MASGSLGIAEAVAALLLASAAEWRDAAHTVVIASPVRTL